MKVLSDFGPIYAETNLDRFPVEPLNTISNLLFLAVAIYWSIQFKNIENKNLKNFLLVSLPLLYIGYVGGSLYHATRAHFGWMLMDVIPIYLIAICTSIYHWRLINFNFFKIIGVFMVMLCLPLTLIWTYLSESVNSPTYGYIVITLPVVLPVILDQIKTKWKYSKEFMIPLVFIIIALGFRVLDSTALVQQSFKIGTHWLWHTFGAMTCHFLLIYMRKRSLYQG